MIKISAELDGILISLGIIVAGNIIKPKNKDVGNFVQGFGIGTGGGTIIHIIDQKYPSQTPHHDLTALVSLPLIFMADKTNLIKNKDIANTLYGIGIGTLTQHLVTEGCSFCGTAYCKNGVQLC